MAKLKKAAQGFEAVFARQMISSMRTASLGDGIMDSSATEQFRDMSDGKLAEAMAGKGSLGIADMLVKQWGARVAGPAGAATATTNGPATSK
ncbi:rod-binding protein [Sphingomonas nostoxanthinifaciens]|uniref:rod-binding protein n=1 Tax=Sphingomonas nostoxanthinifaciens TaxID=2872652 RepID=UPI001CC21CC2|nr:rod-binding protein [Sphingomonas nostoxanthinifaciens]UAK26573.1 rod-binding protein [Sphingomonas nostoxanthinifaciens]